MTADTDLHQPGRECDEQDLGCIQEVTQYHIRQYLTGLSARNLSSHYVHSHARALKTFLNFCVRDGLLESSPFARVRMPRVSQNVEQGS